MVAVARESARFGNSESPGDGKREYTGPRISGSKDQPSRRYEPDKR